MFGRIMLVPLAFEMLSHQDADECAALLGDEIVCESKLDVAIVPRNLHVPHVDYDTQTARAYQFLASGMSSVSTSTSTGPMTVAGESVAPWMKR